MVNSSECITAAFTGHASVPYNKTGKHFLCNYAKRTSSEALSKFFSKKTS